MLCGVAERLRSAAGDITDVSEVARLGGDEFILLLGGLSDQSSALDAAEKIGRFLHERMARRGPKQLKGSLPAGRGYPGKEIERDAARACVTREVTGEEPVG